MNNITFTTNEDQEKRSSVIYRYIANKKRLDQIISLQIIIFLWFHTPNINADKNLAYIEIYF